MIFFENRLYVIYNLNFIPPCAMCAMFSLDHVSMFCLHCPFSSYRLTSCHKSVTIILDYKTYFIYRSQPTFLFPFIISNPWVDLKIWFSSDLLSCRMQSFPLFSGDYMLMTRDIHSLARSLTQSY